MKRILSSFIVLVILYTVSTCDFYKKGVNSHEHLNDYWNQNLSKSNLIYDYNHILLKSYGNLYAIYDYSFSLEELGERGYSSSNVKMKMVNGKEVSAIDKINKKISYDTNKAFKSIPQEYRVSPNVVNYYWKYDVRDCSRLYSLYDVDNCKLYYYETYLVDERYKAVQYLNDVWGEDLDASDILYGNYNSGGWPIRGSVSMYATLKCNLNNEELEKCGFIDQDELLIIPDLKHDYRFIDYLNKKITYDAYGEGSNFRHTPIEYEIDFEINEYYWKYKQEKGYIYYSLYDINSQLLYYIIFVSA